MSILLNNSISALFAAQRALDTTSHNIANVNTDGYSRQRVLQTSRTPMFSGGSYIGMGVNAGNIGRVYDTFLVDQFRSTSTAESGLKSFTELARRVDAIFAGEDTGLPQGLQRFMKAVEGVASDPSSLPAREAMLAEAKGLVDRFHLIDGQLDAVANEVNLRLESGVTRINGLSRAIASVNDQIASALGNPPADLLDQRDQLLKELGEQVDFTTAMQSDGSINVFVGDGQTLVSGRDSTDLVLIGDQFDPSRIQVGYQTTGGVMDISQTLSGGAIGGALDYRKSELDPVRDEMGRIAFGLAQAFNDLHKTGMDLTGAMGGDFFTIGSPSVKASGHNTGAGLPTVTVGDHSQLEARSYELAFLGGSWQVVDAATGENVPTTGSGTAGDPLVVEGLEIVVPAGAAAGDRFQISAVADAASGLGLAVDRPENIAAAGPLGVTANPGNTGSAAAGTPRVVDPGAAGLMNGVRIVFDDANTYRILDGGGTDLTGPQAYTPGNPIAFNGWEVELTGAPAGGDSFDVAPNPGGVGDNSVALSLSEITRQGIFGASGRSIDDLQSGLLTRVGVTTQQAELSLAAQTALREQIELDMQSVSGVNLDEEAVNLMRYQQAYQAAAQAITVADSMFQSILGILR